MADEFVEQVVEELDPLDPGVLDPNEALEASDAALDADATLVVQPEPHPIGKTFAWNYETGERQGTGEGPHMIRGDAALKQWIHKCLRTHAGAHPIHPEGYGLRIPITHFIGRSPQDVEVSELEEVIRDALLFHPAIKDVINFQANFETEDEVTGDAALNLAFRVVRDDATTLRFNTTLSSGEVLTEALV